MAMGDVIARLSVALNLETAAFDKNTRAASGSIHKMQQTMSRAATAIGGALAGMFAVDTVTKWHDMSKAALDAAGSLGETAAQIGVTTNALQEYRYAATQAGVSQEGMDKALAQLTKRLGEAAQGAKAPTEALSRLGITLDDVKGKSTGDVLPMIAEGIAKIKDPAQQAAIAVDLFGKAGQSLLPLLSEGAAGVNRLREDAHKLGVVMSEQAIARADEAADTIAAQERVAEAQRVAILSSKENTEAALAYSRAMTEASVTATKAFAAFVRGAGENDAMMARWRANTAAGFTAFTESLNRLGREISSALASTLGYVAKFIQMGRDLMQGLANGIRNSAGAVWNALKGVVSEGIARAKNLLGIQSPSRVFMEIGAYIGDGLAIGIEGGQGKVAAATRKLTESARKAAEEVQQLLAELFPESVARNAYQSGEAALERARQEGKLSPAAYDESRYRLNRRFSGALGHGKGEIPIGALNGNEALDVTKGMDVVLDKLSTFGKTAGAVTVNVAKSFQDMAQSTISALQNMVNSIKGGGFLDILSAVIGLGMQLGSIGAFGKKIQANINAPQIGNNANGTRNWRGGLSWVGERGPELVNMPRGSQVFNNRESREMMRGRGGVMEIRPSPLFEVYVDGQLLKAAPALVAGSARAGAARIAYQQRRRVD